MKAMILQFLAIILTTHMMADCGCPQKPSSEGHIKKLTFEACEKTYIHPSQIDLVGNAIFVQVNGQILQTSALFRDDRGLYFQDSKEQGICPDFQWECPICHACNDYWNNYCQICWN